MALEKESEADFWEGLYHRQVEKSTSVQNALALSFRSDSPRRTEELLEVEGYGL